MRYTIRLLPLLVLVFVFAIPSYAQTGNINGTVISTDGAPLVGATMLIDRQEITQHFEIVTDDNGKFFHAGLPSGIYRVTLQVDGRNITFNDGIRVRSGDTTDASFDLKTLSDMALESEEGKAAEEARLKAEATRDSFELGRTALNAKNYDEAVTQFEVALESDDTQHVIYANLADALSGAKRYDEAVATYRKAILLAPMEGAYYNNLGIVYGNAGKTEEAIAALEKTAELTPDSAGQAYYNLGAVMTNTGRTAAASEAFKKAIEYDPEMAEAYYQLGISFFGSADTMKEAIPVLQKYLEMAPDGPNSEAAKQLIVAAGGI